MSRTEREVHAVGDTALLRRVDEDGMTAAGIIVPESYRVQSVYCDVVSVGPRWPADSPLHVGDRVVVKGNKGEPVRYGRARRDWLLSVTADDVDAVLDEE